MKIILFLLFSVSAFASDDALFCKEVVESSLAPKQHVSTFSILRGSLFPHKVVYLEQMRSIDDGFIRKNGNNHIVLNILKQGDKNQGEKLTKNLAIYNDIKKELQKNSFAKKVLKAKTEDECLELISQKENEYKEFVELSENLKKYLPFQQSFERLETQKFIKKQMIALTSRGWKVHDALTLDVLSRINKQNAEQLIIVTHATNNGAILDFFNNTIPSNVFANTTSSLRKLSIFSCYTDEVKRTYKIKSLIDKDRFDYIFPIVQPKYRKLFKDITPLFGIKALANFHKNLVYMPKRNNQRGCTLSFPKRTNTIAVFINNNFIGMLDTKMEFYCDLLRDKNTITLNLTNNYSPVFTSLEKLLPNNAEIQTNTNKYQYKLKHFIRNNMYKSSKSFQEESL